MDQEADLPSFSDIFKSTVKAVIFIGPANVGKTALVYRYVLDEVPDRITATVALEFTKRNIDERPGGACLQLHIWDTAGQERYKSVTKHHYRGADACLAVFDVADPSSFANLSGWLTELKENTDPECLLCIVGNKVDLERKVSREEAVEFAQTHNASYFETSSLWPRDSPFEADQIRGGIESIFSSLVSGECYPDILQTHSTKDIPQGVPLTSHFCTPREKCMCTPN